jgi:hypothetical protein
VYANGQQPPFPLRRARTRRAGVNIRAIPDPDGGRMAHECKAFEIDGKPMWFHLETDTSNVLLEKTARAFCWTGPSDEEEDTTSPREAVPGSQMRVEIRHHNKVDALEGDGVESRELTVRGILTFHAVAYATLKLPNGKRIDLEARA